MFADLFCTFLFLHWSTDPDYVWIYHIYSRFCIYHKLFLCYLSYSCFHPAQGLHSGIQPLFLFFFLVLFLFSFVLIAMESAFLTLYLQAGISHTCTQHYILSPLLKAFPKTLVLYFFCSELL